MNFHFCLFLGLRRRREEGRGKREKFCSKDRIVLKEKNKLYWFVELQRGTQKHNSRSYTTRR